ncbi:MAG: carnitine dehydratase [Actinophytocola sp.]|uniref:CoA transferase n=1 Tax=Actinophytocola sp. TaxID=1872138 RepID=UPI001326FC0D|nr:CoA transferase [Actinophytocola sp.]MPZ83498.1 carnitine dehydratase [Actinophytocola sp.]
MPRDTLAAVWKDATGTDAGPVTFDGDEHVLPGPYRVAHAAAVCVGAATLAAAELHHERGGTPAPVNVHIGHAAEAFCSERHIAVAGRDTHDLWAALSGDYRATDGWVRLHANYPHHADAILRALGTEPHGVREAVAARPAVEVEDAVLAAGGAAAVMRDRAGWLADGPGTAVRAEPLVSIEKLGDAPPRPFPPLDRTLADRIIAEHALADRSSPGHMLAAWPLVDRALSGVRVLDLTHVIAGPVATRVLAAHGASVLHVTDPKRPVLHRLVMDTDLGKRSCHVDLDTDEGRATLRALAADADVLVQSYRPDSLARRGFGPDDLAGTGIVLVGLAAYGHTGPWRGRRGFDSLVQMSCGIAADGAADGGGEPTPLPAQALDHGTGWLAAFGIITALRRRAREGGAWHVRLSLARTAEWLHDLGRDTAPATPFDVTPLLAEADGDYGRVTHLRVPGAPPGLAGAHRPGRDPATWW